MAQLSRSDLEGTLGFLGEAAAVTGPDPFPSELLDRLRDLVRCDMVAFDECDCAVGRSVAYQACARGREVDASQSPELAYTFYRLKSEFPLCEYMEGTGDLTAHKLSDFVTRRQWHRLEVYADYFRFFGVEERLMIGLPALPAHRTVVAFDRCGEQDFDERDRLLVDSLQPHLSALDAAARERRLAAALLLAQSGPGLIVLTSLEHIDFATPPAERLLGRYFQATRDGGLPECVRSWLHRDAARLNGNGLPQPATPPLVVERGDRRLTIRKAGRTLMLEEELVTLTNREREIVDALAEGCSNAEIAERLTIAPTTVRKHLENIYAKLGVGSRTAAVAATRVRD